MRPCKHEWIVCPGCAVAFCRLCRAVDRGKRTSHASIKEKP